MPLPAEPLPPEKSDENEILTFRERKFSKMQCKGEATEN